jgi:hypothetical protein
VDFQTANLFDGYMASIIVWDIEAVPDLKGFAAANGHGGRGDDEIRAAMGDKFPKHIGTSRWQPHHHASVWRHIEKSESRSG